MVQIVNETNEVKNLKNLTEEIIQKLTEAYDVLNALDEIIQGDRRIEPLFNFVRRNVKTALTDVDSCRELIF